MGGSDSMPLQAPPSPEEMGHCDVIEIQEIGDTNVILFKQNTGDSRVSTIVVSHTHQMTSQRCHTIKMTSS